MSVSAYDFHNNYIDRKFKSILLLLLFDTFGYIFRLHMCEKNYAIFGFFWGGGREGVLIFILLVLLIYYNSLFDATIYQQIMTLNFRELSRIILSNLERAHVKLCGFILIMLYTMYNTQIIHYNTIMVCINCTMCNCIRNCMCVVYIFRFYTVYKIYNERIVCFVHTMHICLQVQVYVIL